MKKNATWNSAKWRTHRLPLGLVPIMVMMPHKKCPQDCCFLNLISILAETKLDAVNPNNKKFIFKMSRLARHGRWGVFHEIGHNMQRRHWTPGYGGEVTVNIFTLYCMEKGNIFLSLFLLACAHVFMFVCCLLFSCLFVVCLWLIHARFTSSVYHFRNLKKILPLHLMPQIDSIYRSVSNL